MSNSEEDKDSFEKDWEKAFEGTELEPSPLVWSEIEKEISSSRFRLWWRFGLPLLLVLLVGTVAFVYFDNRNGVSTVGYVPQKNEKIFIPSPEEGSTAVGEADSTLTQKSSALNSDASQPANETSKEVAPETNLPTRTPASIIPSDSGEEPFQVDSKQTEEVLLVDKADSSQTQQKYEPNFTNQTNPSLDPSEDQAPTRVLSPDIPTRIFSLNVQKLRPEGWPLSSRVPELSTVRSEIIPRQEINNTGRTPKWWLSLAYVPLQVSTGLQTNYNTYLNKYIDAHNVNNFSGEGFFNDLEENTNSDYSYQIRLHLGWQLNPRLSLRGGLTYTRYQWRQRTNAYFVNQADGSEGIFYHNLASGSVSNPNFVQALLNHPSYDSNASNRLRLSHFHGNNGNDVSLKQSHHYLSLPLEVGWRLNRREQRLDYTLWAGLSTDLFLRARNQRTNGEGEVTYHVGEASAYRHLSLSGSLGLQFSYRWNQRWSGFVEPRFQKSLYSQTRSNSNLELSPQGLGLAFGLKYWIYR